MVCKNFQQQNGQVSPNHTDKNTRSAIENNAENTTSTNLNNNHHNAMSNNISILQVSEERSKNPQNYFQDNTQPNVNTPQHTITSQN